MTMASLCAVKPTVVVPARSAVLARRSLSAKPRMVSLRMRGTGPDKAAIQEAIKEAEETCEGGNTGEW